MPRSARAAAPRGAAQGVKRGASMTWVTPQNEVTNGAKAHDMSAVLFSAWAPPAGQAAPGAGGSPHSPASAQFENGQEGFGISAKRSRDVAFSHGCGAAGFSGRLR